MIDTESGETRVRVESVSGAGSVAIGIGAEVDEFDNETGNRVRFAGDWRPMRDIGEAIAAGEDVIVDVPGWAVL